MSSNKNYQRQEAIVNSGATLLNNHHPTMFSNKNYQRQEAIVNSSAKNHIQNLTKERNDLKAQVQRLQADAALSEAKLSKAHAEIQKLETQLKESGEQLIKAQVNQKVSEALNFLYDAKLKNMQAQIDEFDTLTTQAQEFFGKIWKEFETQSKNKLNESEALRIQGLEDLKACRSEFEDYKTQTEKQFEKLEDARVKAHQVLVAQKTRCSELESQIVNLNACRSEFECYKAQSEKQIEELEKTTVKAHQNLVAQITRCSELESQMICLTSQAQRAHAASQAIQQSLDLERAAFKDRLKKQLAFYQAQHNEFLAEWETTDKRVKQVLIDELVQAVAALPIDVLETPLLQGKAQAADAQASKKRGQTPKEESQTAKKRRID